MKVIIFLIQVLILLLALHETWAASISLGKLTQREHGVSGEVILLSDRILEVRNFTYDGKIQKKIHSDCAVPYGGKIYCE